MTESQQRPASRARQLPPWLALLAGAVVAVTVLVVGLVLVSTQPARWSAQSSLLVLPQAPTSDPDVLAGLYDTLSRGQVAETYAELLRMRPAAPGAGQQPGPSLGDQTTAADVLVEVIPETSVIRVTATADSASRAEQAADAVAQSGRAYIAGLDSPYGVQSIGSATGSAERAGLGAPLLGGIVVALAVIAGVAAQQAVRQLGLLLRRRRVGAPAAPGPDHAPDHAGTSAVEPLFEPDKESAAGDGRRRHRVVRRTVPRDTRGDVPRETTR